MLNKAKKYYNTVKYLKPSQLFYRAFYMVKRKGKFAYPKLSISKTLVPIRMAITELDLDLKYIERFKPEKILEGKITLLNQEVNFMEGKWDYDAKSHLWNYNLHYFEYAVALSARFHHTQDPKYYQSFKELYTDWMMHNPAGHGDAWKPYTISLRIPNILCALELFGGVYESDCTFKEKVSKNLYLQYKFLEKNKELHLLGNHYFENIKTLLLCSLVFDEPAVFQSSYYSLQKEIIEQVLPDGMHFELSVMYHKIILEDILRIAYWVEQKSPKLREPLVGVIQRMLECAISLEHGMGKEPFFNDASSGVAKDLDLIVSAASRLYNISLNKSIDKKEQVFSESGYIKAYSKDIALMFDCGEIGPSYMSGHGHCDALSFEVSQNSVPIFVNSGTCEYQGLLRDFFRSTEAHNTLTVDNKQQSECWGIHRVARRISDVKMSTRNNPTRYIGSYRSYNDDQHYRQLGFCHEEGLIIMDQIISKHPGLIRSYLHLAPGLRVQRYSKDVITVTDDKANFICSIYPINIVKFNVHNDGLLTNYASEFSTLSKKRVIEFQQYTDVQHHGYYVDFSGKVPLNKINHIVKLWNRNLKSEVI